MTVNSDDNKKNTAESFGEKQRHDATRSPRRSFACWSLIAFVMIALALAACAFCMTWQWRQESAESLAALTAQHAKMVDQIGLSSVRLDKSQEEITELDEHLKTILQQQTLQPTDGSLLKIRYLLELAQLNANWSDNFELTSALLSQADHLLSTLHEPRLMPVRQAIADDQLILEASKKRDIMGILMALDAAQKSTVNLVIPQVGNALNASAIASPADPDKETDSIWRARLKKSLDALERLVVVRHYDGAIQPVITPAYTALLRASIHLSLQESQWAVLQGNVALYQLTLKQAINTINQSFDVNASPTQLILAQLSALQALNWVQEKPAIGQALLRLNQAMESTLPASQKEGVPK